MMKVRQAICPLQQVYYKHHAIRGAGVCNHHDVPFLYYRVSQNTWNYGSPGGTFITYDLFLITYYLFLLISSYLFVITYNLLISSSSNRKKWWL